MPNRIYGCFRRSLHPLGVIIVLFLGVIAFVVKPAIAQLYVPDPTNRVGANRFTNSEKKLSGKLERLPSPEQTYSVDELQSIAQKCNPTVAQAMDKIRALRGTWVQSGLRPNPELGWLAEEMGNDGRAGRQGMEFGQQFITAGKLGWNRAIVQQRIRAAECDLQAQRMRVYNDVHAAAHHILADQDRVKSLEELKRINDEVVKASESLVRAQELAQTDLLKAQIEAETTRMRLRAERRELRGTRRALAGLIGRPDLTDIRIDGALEKNLPQLDWEESLGRLFEASPELHRALAAVATARCDVARQKAGRISDIDVGGAVAYNAGSEYTEVSLGVAMPITLFDRNQGNIATAQARLFAECREVDRLRLELHNRLADAFREYQVAREKVLVYEKSIIPKAEESLKLTAEGFRQQETSYLELLNAQRTYFFSNLDYIEALEVLWVAATNIEGLLLRGGLDSIIWEE